EQDQRHQGRSRDHGPRPQRGEGPRRGRAQGSQGRRLEGGSRRLQEEARRGRREGRAQVTTSSPHRRSSRASRASARGARGFLCAGSSPTLTLNPTKAEFHHVTFQVYDDSQQIAKKTIDVNITE